MLQFDMSDAQVPVTWTHVVTAQQYEVLCYFGLL
jgi:hypothetical protein